MMIALPGFKIVTLLKTGVKAVIYRGIKVKDQRPVIIKGLRPEQCTPNNIEQLKHEYAIAQRLNIAAAVKVYALEMHQGIPYLIMEDFEARSLNQLLDQFQEPVSFLKIAIEITSKLAQIHTYNIVHKDIKPENILVNLETSQVKIADFGIAAFIPYQQQIVSSSSRIEGSLPYLSPEQTGRMNRGIDHRSDLYSLGVTFYEMLTGKLPFQGKDPLEWVHCHIAKSPPSPKKLNSDIPQMLCDIISKLLSKVAEQRYQSALGLQFDLERCLKQLETTKEIQSFVLGEQDISERFQITQKAKASTAYIPAKRFFSVAMNLLAENAWIEEYEQTFNLFIELAECEFLTGNLEQAFYYIIKLIIFFTYGQYAEALNCALKLSKFPDATLALPIETDYILYYSLTLTALYPTASFPEQEQFLLSLELHQQRLQYWANHCPANFLHKSQLVAAEIARIQGRYLEAMRLYDQSIASAREQGFVQYEALANELGAKFYFEREFELIAKTYLQEAKNAYVRWEASAKVKHLEESYPQLLPRQQLVSNGTFFSTGEHLDFLSILKASQTISSEIVLSRLLKTLMQIVIEQAGAEIGYLLLEHEQNLVIEVEAKVNPQAEKLNVSRSVFEGEISQVIPQSILNYVQRTQETVILPNATEENLFSGDEYVIQKQPKSVLCLPIARQSKLLGILYLENNLIPSAFTQEKLSVLEILTVQIAISLENARLYQGLENSQEKLNLALKSGKIGVWSWDIAKNLFDWDEQVYQLFGLTPEVFVGTSEAILTRLHPDDSPLLAQSLSRAINEGVEHDLEYRIIRDDGSIRYLACRGKAFFNEAGKATHMSGVVLDISDVYDELRLRKQAEAERIQLIQEQTARQEAEADQQRAAFLAQVSATLASCLDYESTLASVANLVVPYFADWCSVDLLQDNQLINRVAVAHRDPEKVKLGWQLHQHYPRKLDEPKGVPKVLRTGIPEMVTEISDALLTKGIQDAEHLRIIREIGLNSCIISPLMARERIFGAISFFTAESERRYSMADLSLAEDIAHRAAIAIDNACLYQEAQQAQKTAEQALERIARLQSITAALSESLTPAQVSEVIVEQSMAALGANSALVALLNENKTELEIVQAVGYNQDLVDAWRYFPIDSPSPLAEAVRTGQPIWAESKQNRIARYPHLAEAYAQYDIDAWISIPLMVEGSAVGGVTLGFIQLQELSEEDQAFILAVAQQCAQAIARAHLYEAERTARNAAESANRIKDEFLAVLSHELRTPLNPILGWAKLMRSRKLDQATSDRALETIERNAKLQTQLIEDLLDVSRILQGKLNLNFGRINLVSVIEAAIETVRLSAQAKSIEIQTIFESGVGTVLGDANRLQQVIWNILSNAIKFTPSEGQVKIKLEQVGSQIQICVTDTGKGIPPEFLPYVFDYFRQADGATTRQFGGLGLGLAIVRHLVELHGGTVQAESLGEEKGATFIVRLPCLQDEGKGIKDKINTSSLLPVQSLPLFGLEILVVDDDADMREFLPFMLEQYGATVTSVASAIAALTALSQSQPNLIISDIGMPEMDGYMLMRQIRSLKPEQGGTIPAIALTAYAGEIDYQQAIAVGFQQHISKPVDPEELVKAIGSLIS
jgi:PAS domain S-box-containing protein